MGRRGRFVAFREEAEIVNIMDSVAADRGIDRSGFIREAVRRRLAEMGFLPERAKRSLGASEAERK